MNETYVDMVVIVSIHCLDHNYCVQNGRMSALRANLCVFSYADEKECLYYKKGRGTIFRAHITCIFGGIKRWNVTTCCSLWMYVFTVHKMVPKPV